MGPFSGVPVNRIIAFRGFILEPPVYRRDHASKGLQNPFGEQKKQVHAWRGHPACLFMQNSS